jgi:uncharacterized protein YjbI with pentapeptide repeats
VSNEGKGEQREDAGKAAPATEGRGWRIGFNVLKNPSIGFSDFIYVIAGLFALAVLVLVGFGLFASFQLAYETATGKFADRIEAAKVFFPILLALVGGPLLIWRVITAHIQAQAARHQADTGREAHYTSLFTKAVEQLGATRDVSDPNMYVQGPLKGGKLIRETVTKTEPNLEVRLGAIYALERIARDSDRDHWPIMEVLCAYLRNSQNSGVASTAPVGELDKDARDMKQERPSLIGWKMSLPKPRLDIQAAVDVIGRRSKSSILRERALGLQLDFSGANLQLVKFDRGDFSESIFHTSQIGGASFVEADLTHVSFLDVNASCANFDRARMQYAKFMYAHIEDASFQATHLANSEINHVNAWFTDFERAVLTESYLTDGAFVAASFTHANLANCRIEFSNFESAKFRFSQLDRAWLISVDIPYGEFRKASLVAARFDDVGLSKANFSGANLQGLVAFEADLSDAEGLTVEQLANALGDASTKLPDGITRPETWPDRELSSDEQEALTKKAGAPTG